MNGKDLLNNGFMSIQFTIEIENLPPYFKKSWTEI